MNTKKYNWVLYIIALTIIITITVQFYWNYNNYLVNKQQVKNEIQNSLDIAVEEYYSNLSKANFSLYPPFETNSGESKIFKSIFLSTNNPGVG